LLLELRPEALYQTETTELFKYLVNAFTGRTQVPVILTFESAFTLPGEVKISLYRIAQEALNNIAKHASANQVTITFQVPGYGVVLEIQDNGIGYETGGSSAEHLGLKIMKERADAIGAEFSITSKPDQGTNICVFWKPPKTG
jgi:signal transduction histidine kinase